MDESRQTLLDIDLGGEQVLLERVEVDEALSTPFAIAVDVIAPLGELDLLPHLGKEAVVTIKSDDELQRYFHGLLVAGEYTEQSPAGFHYRLQLRPWTYFLSQNRDFAIYQELDALEIIKKVLEEATISDVDYGPLGQNPLYAKREYCVQYGESDFTFISRLMEEEGIYYYFEHNDEKHVMVLCKGPSSHSAGTPESLTYNPMSLSVFNTDSAARAQDTVDTQLQSWTERVVSGGEIKATSRDFDFMLNNMVMETNKEAKEDHPKDQVEVYRYPGNFVKSETGEKLNEVALNALRANRVTYRGQSQAAALSCGRKVKVTHHPNKRLNGEFLIVRTQHSITAEHYRTGDGKAEQSYNVLIDAIPSTIVWQPPQITPRPIVHGLESAMVSGPSQEQIYTDEFGRVKVRFYWDRSGSESEKSSCWMRVSQTGGLGNIILPRVGHEVLVDFLGGDPDRPVVVGRVFNASNMPVYKLPQHKTRALWRTRTYGSGSDRAGKGLDTGNPGANELRFEDKVGEEEVFLHAQSNMNTRVRNDETHHVGNNQEILVRANRSEKVEENEKVEVGQGRKVTIGTDDTLEVGNNLKIKAGTNIEIEAGASITIKVGGSTIKMDPTSIKVESSMINVNAFTNLDAKGTNTTVKGLAFLTLTGALVKIN